MDTSPSCTFSNPVAELRADANGVAHLVWQLGPRPLADFQAALNALLHLLLQLRTGKLLVDQAEMLALSPAEQNWVRMYWLPQAIARGHYRYVAVLPTRDPVARMASAAVGAPATADAPRQELFETPAAALLWLQRQVVIESRL